MELDEFHVTKLGAGPVRHGVAVTGRDGRIGRFAIELASAAGGEDWRSAVTLTDGLVAVLVSVFVVATKSGVQDPQTAVT